MIAFRIDGIKWGGELPYEWEYDDYVWDIVIKQCEYQMATTVYGVASLAQSIWLQ